MKYQQTTDHVLQNSHFDGDWYDLPPEDWDEEEEAIFEILTSRIGRVGVVFLEVMDASGDGMQYRLKPL